MSAPNDLAVLIERWFTDRLMRHRGVSSNHRLLSRHLPAPVCIRADTPWQVSVAVDTAGFGRAFHRRIPGGPRDTAIRLSEDPESPSFGHSVFLQICVVRGAGP